MATRLRNKRFERSAKEWPEPVASKLIAEELEREARDKKRVKLCPVCGRRPEIPFDKSGRHIYNGHCEKCDARFVIHVCG